MNKLVCILLIAMVASNVASKMALMASEVRRDISFPKGDRIK